MTPVRAARSPAVVAAALSRSPLFSVVSDEHRDQIERASQLRMLGPSEVLWRVGQQATHLGLVIAGRVALARPGDDKEGVFDVAAEGELLGDVGFALATVYTATVFCPRRARVLMMPADLLRHILEREPRMGAALTIHLATRFARLMRRFETLTALSVERRLARTLLELADQIGQPFLGGTLIPMRLRRADLASLAATTVETTSRKLTLWSAAGVLQKQPAGLLIRDLDALRRLSHGEHPPHVKAAADGSEES